MTAIFIFYTAVGWWYSNSGGGISAWEICANDSAFSHDGIRQRTGNCDFYFSIRDV